MPDRNPDYLKWVRKQLCAACDGTRCARVHAHHHTGRRGHGQKARDQDAFPLCWMCHDDFHTGRGVFTKWNHEQRTAWQDKHADAYWNEYNDKEIF